MKIFRITKLGFQDLSTYKKQILTEVFIEYGLVVNKFIDLFWEQTPSKTELLKPIVDSVLPTWLSARLRKVAAREAIDLILSVKNSMLENPTKPTHRGKRIATSAVNVLLQKSKTKHFDKWLHIHSIGKHPVYGKVILDIPIKLHKHYHKLTCLGKQLDSYILTFEGVILSFGIETGPKQNPESCIGIDTGITHLGSVSTGHYFGNETKKFIDRIKRCKYGSKGQKRSRRALRQYVDETVKQIFDTLNPSLIVVENLKKMNYKTKVKRRLTRNMRRSLGIWTYRYWLDRLQRECEIRRSSFRSVNPAYTSQRCQMCGHIERRNRSGDMFRCLKCGYEDNADINAARNILDLFLTGPYGASCKPMFST